MEDLKACDVFNEYFNKIILDIEKKQKAGELSNKEIKAIYYSLSVNFKAMIDEY